MATATSFASPQMNWDAPDPITAFARFKQKCQLIFSSVLKDADDEEKVSYILLWSGEKGLDIYNSWTFTKEEERKKPAIIFERFENQLEPKTSHRIHRYTLQGMRQEQSEPVDDFISRLKNLAAKCQFRDSTEVEDRVLDQLIWGSKNPDVQKSLIGRDKSCNNCGKQHPRNKCPAYGTLCRKCGKANHWQSVCRSSKRKQFIQGRKPVFKKSIHTIEDRGDEDNDEILTISTIEVNTIEDTQHSTTHDTREVFATLEITQPEKKRKINLQCKVDTGAQSNVLPIRLLRIIAPEKFDDEGNLKPEVLEKNEAVLSAYGGSVIKQLGTINISCKYKEKKINCIFYVTDTSGPAILGLKACIALKLVSLHCTLRTNQSNQADPTSSFNSPAQNPGTCKKSSSYIGSHVPLEERPSITSKQELMDMYPECFNGTVGCFDDYTYHITLDPEVSPVVHAPRKVPIELKDKLQAELREMESQDIIAKVTQPTDWVNSLVIREKENGRLRLCLDPRDLNKAIKREHHPIPTLEEFTPKLSGAKLFSKLDARNGYWNVKLDDESSYLTTFNTPFGRYRFLRMPFGLRMSQDIFQFKIDETYRDCLGAIGIADDVTVYGKNDKEHDLHLHETMERTRQAGIKLKSEKCVIKTKECNFFGMLYTPDGVKPSPEKVRAIESLEPPKDKELHTFLGMATYMSSFIPNLADHTAPLRNLLKENADFTWNPSHSKAFEKVKALICTTTTLAYYDRNEPVVLHVDASIKGLGAALFQNDKPIAFASKALTPAETRYANIERELLAVVYTAAKNSIHISMEDRSWLKQTIVPWNRSIKRT